jgi:crotonobetainyl-CoA:carnitine CoA-transferase CaiB-like acyl-CoA transferase
MIRSVIADKCTAITAASAALAALLERERNGGQGQLVHVPMMNAYAQLTLPDVMTNEAFQPTPEGEIRIPNLFHAWNCSDGHLVGMPIEDKQYLNLCKALGREDLAEDDRFKTLGNRMANCAEMIELIDAEFGKWTWRDALELLHKHDVPFAPVYDLEMFMNDPQVKHNGTIFDVEEPEAGTMRYVRHPSVYERTPATMRRHPPRYGQHTGEILSQTGFTEEEIAALREAGVVA